jgi:uncharacterized protein (TIGR02145 family)
MKKIFFLFAMLAGIAASAQSHISIQMLGATYTTSPAVKFRVSWSSVPTVTGQTHNAKIWVWIDFLKVNADNTTSGNTWTRADISTTPSVSSSPTSTATLETGNNKGFWLNGVTGSYSATVTATLSGIPANTKFNWCAYVSDCPPNVTATNGTYTFKGTPPFTLSNGTATQTVTGKTLAASSLTIIPTTIKDKTECPGVFCPYTGNDLLIDATHSCQIRTSGAYNWVAWITDSRDSKSYRIAQLSTGLWTMDDYLNYTGHSAVVTNEKCTAADPDAKEYWRHTLASSAGTLCPDGWRLPNQEEYLLTVNEWYTHLQKLFTKTGETVSTDHTFCQSNYVSFVVSGCLGSGYYGNRTQSINPYSAAQPSCYRYTASPASSYKYSGYARCVRDL